MLFIDQKRMKSLYFSGLSMADIAKKEAVSIHTVVYWMEKYGIPRRSRSEATYTQKNPNGDPFKITFIDNIKKTELLSLGIGLFLGEGDKRNNFQIRFANSNPQIIKIFLNFLRRICGIEEQKIKAVINIFDDRIYQIALNFWIKVTKIPENNFYKPTIRARKIGTYKNKSKYGTITILVANKKILNLVKSWCDSYIKKYAWVVQW